MGSTVTSLGGERRQIWVGGRTDWENRQDGWFRLRSCGRVGQDLERERNRNRRRSKSGEESSEKPWTDGEMVLRRELREGVDSLESLEFEFGAGSPGAGSDEAQSRQAPGTSRSQLQPQS